MEKTHQNLNKIIDFQSAKACFDCALTFVETKKLFNISALSRYYIDDRWCENESRQDKLCTVHIACDCLQHTIERYVCT